METDSDVVSACKTKLSHFRIKELKDVLTQVGLSKQGKKQDLTDRILALLYDEGTPGLFRNNKNGREGLLEIIDVTYRNMQEAVTSDSNTKKHNGSSSSRLRPKEQVAESSQAERKVRCPCGTDTSYETQHAASLIQCVDPNCSIWQHRSCVIIPDRLTGKISVPSQFLCEICRVKRSDPFWLSVTHSLSPVKLVPASIPVDGTNPHVIAEKIFKLAKADRELLHKNTEYDVQVWCMLFNDTVPYRIQWPQYADLQVNGRPVKIANRPISQQLGANGRDDGVKIASQIMEGSNKLSLSFTDARSFCFGVRLVRRLTLEQVFAMIPKETDGEPLEDALARIQRCIGGGITTGNDDSDSDLEVIADSVPVSLRCPMSGSRMKTAGRFKPCAHMGCFDLETFVGINERTRKWQCPICLTNYSLEDIIIDPFFNRILQTIGSCSEEINEVDMKPTGCWRVKKAREAGDLAKWHKPDGSIDEFPVSDNSGKDYALESNNLANDMQKNVVNGSLMNQSNDEAENNVMEIISMSSTTSGNDQNPNTNQDELEVSSVLTEFGQNHEINQKKSGFPDADIIVLSDSDDDNDVVSVIYPEIDPIVNPPPKNEGHSDFSLAENIFSSPADAPNVGPTTSEIGHCSTSGALSNDCNNENLEASTDPPVSQLIDPCEPQNSVSDHQLSSVNELSLVNSNREVHLNGHVGPSSNVEDLQNLFPSAEDSLAERTDGDFGPGSPSESGSDLSGKRKMCDGPFSFPRQKRSNRHRAHRAEPSSIMFRETAMACL